MYASRWKPILALYGSSLLLSLIQIWPLFGQDALHHPLLIPLADRTVDVFVDLVSTTSDVAMPAVAAWSGVAVLLAFVFGMFYNLLSGGIMSAWAGNRPFWQGCRYLFWSLMWLGGMLWVLLLIALAIGSWVGVTFGITAGTIIALTLAQLVNLLGEYARAAAVIYQRRNPFALVANAFRVIVRHLPGALSLGLIGLALHVGIALFYGSVARKSMGFPLTIVLEQGVVLAWLWVKVLRLGWAFGITQATQGSRVLAQ